MVVAGLLLLVLIGIGAAIAAGLSRRSSGPVDLAAEARRTYLYGIALVALGMLVAGLAGLIEAALVAASEATGGAPAAVGEATLRGRVSFSGALTAIGLLAWAIHWGLTARFLRRDGDAERDSTVRKLFLYTVLLVGGIIITLAFRQLLVDLLELAFGRATWSNVIAGDVISPFSLLAVSGTLWLYYERVARADRRALPEVGAGATLRRWYVYGLGLFGLLLFLFGTASLVETLWEAVADRVVSATVGGDWLGGAVAGRAGSVVAGLAAWSLIWSWSWSWFRRADDADPERRSTLRKVYLYAVLAIVVAWTVWNLGQILYRVSRALLTADAAAPAGGLGRDLGPSVAAVLVFGLAWLYHARQVEREASLAGERGEQAAIRRIYGSLVALVAVLTLATGLIGTGATLVDLAAQPGAVRPTQWWEEAVSLYGTLIVVGLPIWLASWTRLQREATDPEARRSLARRIYLFLAFGLAVLTLLGSGAFTLYQVLRLTLGERWTAAQTSDLIWAASSAAVAGLLLVYHLRVFRGDAAQPARVETDGVSVGPPAPILVIVRAANPRALEAFRHELAERTPSGVDLQFVEADEAELTRLLRNASPPGNQPS